MTDGWVLVPREPPEAMVRAFNDARPGNAVQDDEGYWTAPASDWFRARYAAMLAAAPPADGWQPIETAPRDTTTTWPSEPV
jgi:hypothetical protein